MIYLKTDRRKTNSLLEHLDDASTHLSISKYNPKQAAQEIESDLDHWKISVGDITEIEIKDFRSNLSAKSSMPDDYILTVETLAKEINDLRLEIFEELNGVVEL